MIGETVTLRNMKFNSSAFAQCQARCSLQFTDSSGVTFNAVFFKAAYEDVLKSARGRVTVIGTLSKRADGYGIMVQDLK
jgi:hypothetical protein